MAYKQAQWEQKFLDLYKASGNVTLSAHGAGIHRHTVYDRKLAHPEFAARMEEAYHEAIERLEAEAWNRARKTSDTLLIFLLKALKPDMYRENIKITIEGGVDVALINQTIAAIMASGVDPKDAFNRIIEKAHAKADSG